mmetsp:Transcript_129318/g.413206  ORF Transcript_129318/g.413206 Transcript_129318/m.413206 type:complete len:153 (-) Transcript_129318:66-524(-)
MVACRSWVALTLLALAALAPMPAAAGAGCRSRIVLSGMLGSGLVHLSEAFWAEAGAVVVVSSAFSWLQSHAKTVWHSIQRWWGDDAEWKTVWADYKRARNEIITTESGEELRRILVSDLREDFRTQHPQCDYKFNWQCGASPNSMCEAFSID